MLLFLKHATSSLSALRPESNPLRRTTDKADSVKPDLIFIGIVGRPHGLHGAFFVSSRQEPISKSYKSIYIGATEASAQAADVISARMQGDRPVLQCSLATTREAAAALTGAQIYVPREVVHAAHRSTALWSDIEGCTVMSAEGSKFGVITSIYHNGASGVVRINSPQGDTAEIPLVGALFDLDDVSKIRREKILTSLLPDEALAAYWSSALAQDDGGPQGDRG